MAKKDGSTVTASSIISAFVFALLIEITNSIFSISITIGLRFSGVLFSILYSICVILLFMPVLRKYRQKRFNWKVLLGYVVPGLLILILTILQPRLIYDSLTINTLFVAILFGLGVVRSIDTGSKKHNSR